MSDQSQPRRAHPRVTHTIHKSSNKQWRVAVKLDGNEVRRAYFDDYTAALAGAMDMEDQVIEEANLV